MSTDGTVDGMDLAARLRGQAFDIRADTDVAPWMKRKNLNANALGRWRCTYTWNPATERTEMTAMVDTATAKNLSGTAGP